MTELAPIETEMPCVTSMMQIQDQVLSVINGKGLREILETGSQVEAMHAYTRKSDEYREASNNLAELSLRLKRRAGEILAEMNLSPGRPENGNTMSPLKHAGVSKRDSSHFQKIASIPDDEFEDMISTAKRSGDPVTVAGAVRRAKQLDATVIDARPVSVERHTAKPPEPEPVDWEACYRELHAEVQSALERLDELAELWGDEGNFRSCRDLIRDALRGAE